MSAAPAGSPTRTEPIGMSARTAADLAAAGLDPAWVAGLVALALAEDLGPGANADADVTSVATIPAGAVGVGDVVARAGGVVAGLPVAVAVLEAVCGEAVEVRRFVDDGARVGRGEVLLTVRGPLRRLLTAERTMLNLLSRASGIATHTRRWADELAGSGCTVLDTRKTTPGLRALEKYAVRCGGGDNKRMGLYDVAMVKDNHVVAAGGVAAAFRAVRAAYPRVDVQVECDTVEQAMEAVAAGARFLLCDNMTPDVLRKAVTAVGGRAEIEATGGMVLENARAYAETGVDYISVGALTHSTPILDVAFDLRAAVGDAGEGETT